MAAVDHLKPPPSHAKSLDTLTGTVNFLTLTTTLVTTVLISYRIHSVVNKELSWGAKAQFNHILDILIQSAVLYAFAALTNAVGSVISFPATNSVPLIGTQYFTSIFFAFTTVRICYLNFKCLYPSPFTRDLHQQLWWLGSRKAVAKKRTILQLLIYQASSLKASLLL
jgi:hypothetical protein